MVDLQFMQRVFHACCNNLFSVCACLVRIICKFAIKSFVKPSFERMIFQMIHLAICHSNYFDITGKVNNYEQNDEDNDGELAILKSMLKFLT